MSMQGWANWDPVCCFGLATKLTYHSLQDQTDICMSLHWTVVGNWESSLLKTGPLGPASTTEMMSLFFFLEN